MVELRAVLHWQTKGGGIQKHKGMKYSYCTMYSFLHAYKALVPLETVLEGHVTQRCKRELSFRKKKHLYKALSLVP